MIYENNCNIKTYLCLIKIFLNTINTLLNKSIIMVLTVGTTYRRGCQNDSITKHDPHDSRFLVKFRSPKL